MLTAEWARLQAVIVTLVEDGAGLIPYSDCRVVVFHVPFINSGQRTASVIAVPVDLSRSTVVYLHAGLCCQISGISGLIGELHAVRVYP